MRTYKYDLDGVSHSITVTDNSTLLLDDRGELLIDYGYLNRMNVLF